MKSRRKSKHQPPGQIVLSKDDKLVKLDVTDYTKEKLVKTVCSTVTDCMTAVEDSNTVTWVDIRGLSDSKLINDIGKSFGIHTLWLEDVLNTDHRPKLEELDDIIFCIIKAVKYEDDKSISFEQVSLFLGKNFVISFQEDEENVFTPVDKRLEKMKGRIRESKADYLFYALIDSIVDDYYTVLEKIGTEVEDLEELIANEFNGNIYKDISRLRNELIFLRKSASPIREVLNQCTITEKEEVQLSTKKYFKDAHDHIVQVVDIIDSSFQMLDSARDAFNSMQANKMNEVMKVLTTFASIFIPLTFIAGIYGMNFEHMPELKWEWGYYYVWGLMISIGLGLGLYFKKKKWL